MKRAIVLFSVAALMQGCNEYTSEPRPEVFTLDNIDRLVVEDILVPEKLDPRDKDYRYLAGAADLNGDGRDELMVLMQDPYFCGSGGCMAYLFDDKGVVLHRMTVTEVPILLSNRVHNGWKDLYVWSDGSLRTLTYDGTGYPSNPSVAPAYDRQLELEAAQSRVEVQEVFVQDGYDLKQVTDVPIFYPVHSYQFTFRHHGDPDNLYHVSIDMVTGEMANQLLPLEPK
ncbi:hypothetical protein [Vibrio sp. 10N]|uniref:hypothetical protein n=1 Tax=Vibrio sp. 10N TaxID=3058938 RepID=UPI0028139F10|nr:hypothetical protein VB10N_39460 [Vibrio sp. 10N]